MRTAHWKAHLLPLLLLSLHSVSVCLAVSCRYDKNMKNLDSLNIAAAKEETTGKDWEPLRIVASAEDLYGPPKYCEKPDGSIVERSSQGAVPNCKVVFASITAEKSKILIAILGRAIALHTDRLLVQRSVGPLMIPDFSTHQFCKYFNVPAEHRTKGVANADMVLYIAFAHESGDEGAVTFGVTCARSAGGRPIAGSLTFGDGNDEVSRSTVRLTAHHIAHALGFSYNEMKSRNMIMDNTVRSKPNPVSVVKSDKTKEVTKEHYGCTTAEGMELEDGKKNNMKTLSHWERRNAKDELMAQPAGVYATSFMGFYTSFTMAAFEDMGYYKANFTMAEHMEYGRDTGCNFLTDKCMENGKTKWPHIFCDDSESTEKTTFCTSDRLGLGACALATGHSRIIPSHFQYFATKEKAGFRDALTDYCPVVEQDASFVCTNVAQQGKLPGSLLDKNSMCLDGSELKAKTDSATVTVGGVCVEISCESGSVKVKYLGDNNTWHDCHEGTTLTPSSTSKSFESGTIKCPKYKEVCTVDPDGISLIKGATKYKEPIPDSSVPFGLTSSVAFLVVLFAWYLIA